MRKIIKMKRITRAFVKMHPDWVFLFGDNLKQKGYGGQAREMRGEPNAIGIPTKKNPDMLATSFFTDRAYKSNCAHIDKALALIPKDRTVVIPSDGLGTGLARLEESAPKTFEYLNLRLKIMLYDD